MITLLEINKSKRKYTEAENEILIIGMFESKKLNSKQRSLDLLIGNKLSNAIALDKFSGRKNKILMIYGNESIKRIAIVGLGKQKDYTSDMARSAAADLVHYAVKLDLSDIGIDGESFNLGRTNFTQAFSEGLTLGSYEFNNYKTKEENNNKLQSATIYGNADKKYLDRTAAHSVWPL